jgi:hypothetical protein
MSRIPDTTIKRKEEKGKCVVSPLFVAIKISNEN